MTHLHHSHEQEEGISFLSGIGRIFVIGIILNTIFVMAETIAGLKLGSLGLLTDAGHNLGDVVSLALALFAFKIAKKKGNLRYTYGYRKATIHVALINSSILLIAIGAIGWEAVNRLMNPAPVEGIPIAIVACIGIVINSLTALFFAKEKEKDLNIKGAYLHMAADALVSTGVVVAGLVIFFTHWFWMDSVISFIVIIVIIKSTWNLFQDSVKLSLDAVPKEMDLPSIQKELSVIEGVADVHHIHIWPISTTETAFTAHVLVQETSDFKCIEKIKEAVRKKLNDMNIEHATLEIDQVHKR